MTCFCVSDNGEIIATGSKEESAVKVWNKKFEPLQTLRFPYNKNELTKPHITCLTFHYDENDTLVICAGTSNMTVHRWLGDKLTNALSLEIIQIIKNPVSVVSFSPCGTSFVTVRLMLNSKIDRNFGVSLRSSETGNSICKHKVMIPYALFHCSSIEKN